MTLELRWRALPQRLRVVVEAGSRRHRLVVYDGGDRIGGGRGRELVHRVVERRRGRRRIKSLLRVGSALQALELGLLLGREAWGRGAGAECGRESHRMLPQGSSGELWSRGLRCRAEKCADRQCHFVGRE